MDSEFIGNLRPTANKQGVKGEGQRVLRQHQANIKQTGLQEKVGTSSLVLVIIHIIASQF